MVSTLATSTDVDNTGHYLGAAVRLEAALVRKDLEILVRDVTIRTGYMLTVGLCTLFAALRFT